MERSSQNPGLLSLLSDRFPPPLLFPAELKPLGGGAVPSTSHTSLHSPAMKLSYDAAPPPELAPPPPEQLLAVPPMSLSPPASGPEDDPEKAGREVEELDDGDTEEGEEEADIADETGAETQGEGVSESERQKLADGFFEIEDIRRKRTRKGQLQYLIKWRGWPESANTWEPHENLQSCADIIEAFEENASKSQKKRRRKSNALFTVTRRRSVSGSAPIPKVRSPVGIEEGGSAGKKEMNVGGMAGMADEAIVIDSDMLRRIDHGEGENGGREEVFNFSDEAKGNEFSEEKSDRNISVHLRSLEADGNVLPNVNSSHMLAGCSRSIGARRRKSGSVKRFDLQTVEAQHTATVSGDGSCGKGEKVGAEDADSPGDEVSKNKADDFANPAPIIKILMPVQFSTSMANNMHDVSVTFRVLCSDGKEALVTNKSLKVTNPDLLINFYEQHLRYGPS